MNVKLPLSLIVVLALIKTPVVFSQATKSKPAQQTVSVNLPVIERNELRSDLYKMAGDHFRGREAGTLDELAVSAWLGERARAAGCQPAGDNGTFFQFFSLWRNRISSNSNIKIGARAFHLWNDVLVFQIAPCSVSAPVVYVPRVSKEELDKTDVKGKAVALEASKEGINLDVSLPEWRYPYLLYRKYVPDLIKRGAAAVIFIADALGEKSWNGVQPGLSRGLYDIEGGPNEKALEKPPVLWVHGRDAGFLKGQGLVLQATIHVEHFEYPSVNIVAKIEGTDPVLKKEYVLYSGHQDHDGIREPEGTDSIFNGADDNASVSVAMLAIARAFKKAPARRSALFVWHGAEERGLLGSRWFSAHPTVPKASVVAVLNGDMIGRNHPDSAALLGVQPPHRNSADLVALALEANKEGPRFKLDTLWDKAEHDEVWYFRSDHLSYARAGIPALFFTTLLHPDYHTPKDEAARIDMDKLVRMTEWMHRAGRKVANVNHRPKVDPNFRLER